MAVEERAELVLEIAQLGGSEGRQVTTNREAELHDRRYDGDDAEFACEGRDGRV